MDGFALSVYHFFVLFVPPDGPLLTNSCNSLRSFLPSRIPPFFCFTLTYISSIYMTHSPTLLSCIYWIVFLFFVLWFRTIIASVDVIGLQLFVEFSEGTAILLTFLCFVLVTFFCSEMTFWMKNKFSEVMRAFCRVYFFVSGESSARQVRGAQNLSDC